MMKLQSLAECFDKLNYSDSKDDLLPKFPGETGSVIVDDVNLA